MTVVFVAFAIIGFGAAAMWAGTILQITEDPERVGDAKVLLGVGLGMLLAGCGVAVCLSQPDQQLEAKRQAAVVQLTQDVRKAAAR